jgi:hypothetical protein
MGIAIQTREYRLPAPVAERVRLSFFLHEHHFLEHVRGHIVRTDEPWGELLGERAVEKCRQIRDRPEVSLVEEVYNRVVQVLDDGIDGATERPVIIAFTQRLGGVGGSRRQGYCFLADEGYYVVAHGDCVRTALFVSDAASDSPSTRFRKAWHALKKKYGQRSYDDTKGGDCVQNEQVDWVSKANWDVCPIAESPATQVPSAAGTTSRLRARLGRTLGESTEERS